MVRNNKKIYITIVILVGVILLIATSYALWQITLKQADENRLTTSCFRINFKDQDSINLTDTYPMSDEEVKKLKPYTFTITNTCNTHVAYRVFFHHDTGSINAMAAATKAEIMPSIYLDSNVRLVSGEGSKENSFKIEL